MRIPIVSPLTDAIFGKKKDPMDDPIYLPAALPPVDMSQYSTPEFQEAQYRQSELNMKVESKDDMIATIARSHLSSRCKSAFAGIVQTYYDRNILLTDLTGKNQQNGSSGRASHDRILAREDRCHGCGAL